MTAQRQQMSVAPMMRHSHRHARVLWHMLCPQALLYTEMCAAAAVARGRQDRHDPRQGDVVLQVAGNDPRQLAEAARRGEAAGYCAINLNCGCPSAKVTAGGFGACQMANPQATARCVAAMSAACAVPVTVKCRLAIDDLDPDRCLTLFARSVRNAGCSVLVVHARKAWLGGLKPKQNRSRPPLEPERVTRLKRELPDLQIITNGGIHSVREAIERAAGVDGVMLGRAIVARPALLTQFKSDWYGQDTNGTNGMNGINGTDTTGLDETLDHYLGYCDERLREGEHPRRLIAPLGPLAAGRVNGRRFRRSVAAATATADLASVRASWS